MLASGLGTIDADSWLAASASQPVYTNVLLHCPPLPNASTHARTYVRTLADHGCLKFGTPGALHTSAQLQAES